MNNGGLYFISGILVVVVGLMAYTYYGDGDTEDFSVSAGDKEISMDIDG